MRRMMLAASMLAARKSTYDIAGALGFGPSSPLATRAIDGAKRFGLARLAARVSSREPISTRVSRTVEIKDRAEALSALVLDLMSQ